MVGRWELTSDSSRQIAQHLVARFHCGSAVVGRSRDLASVQESDSLVLTREGVSIDHAGCVGDFDGVPQFVADEGDLHIRRRRRATRMCT